MTRPSSSLLAFACLTAAFAATASAQTTTPPTPPTTQQRPAIDTPSTSPSAPSATMPAPTSSGQWYSSKPNELRASKLIGTTVRNAAAEAIGEVNEIILDDSGRVAAMVIGVGGFLGLGEREVAIPMDGFRVTRDANGTTAVSVNSTKEALQAAPVWRWRN